MYALFINGKLVDYTRDYILQINDEMFAIYATLCLYKRHSAICFCEIKFLMSEFDVACDNVIILYNSVSKW